jgi:hypothetical protein
LERLDTLKGKMTSIIETHETLPSPYEEHDTTARINELNSLIREYREGEHDNNVDVVLDIITFLRYNKDILMTGIGFAKSVYQKCVEWINTLPKQQFDIAKKMKIVEHCQHLMPFFKYLEFYYREKIVE